MKSIFREGLFEGQVALVTGGGTGIGRRIALELAALGAKIVICSRSIEKLEPTRDEIASTGAEVLALPCNIRDEEQVKATIAATVAQFGRLDMLVNNGGGQFQAPAETISAKGFHAVVETNLTGTFYMMKEAMLQSMKEHSGAIVNIVMENWRGYPMMAHSGAARAGVINLTQSLALEWAQYGIRVNSVAPGLINSSGLKTYPPQVQAMLGKITHDIPARRMGTEAEIAASVVFLLSPAAAFISGETLKVDGAGSLYRLQGFVIPEHEAWEDFND
jgi:citronellol/citronellal dehydrogenase